MATFKDRTRVHPVNQPADILMFDIGYAIHLAGCSLALKRNGLSQADVQTFEHGVQTAKEVQHQRQLALALFMRRE